MIKNVKKESSKLNILRLATFCFLVSFLLTLIIFYFTGIEPFGNRTLIRRDAAMQYIDFFRYYKEILNGNMDIKYTLSNCLGGDTLAIFSYYLASPINLLIALFSKDNLTTFFSFAVCIKIALSSFASAFFLKSIYKEKLNNFFAFLLSISYGLMEYNISQSSNIMWLDGIYVLPLIILGVHKVITENNFKLLSISVGLSIILNWYTAGISCLFSILWFIFEFIIINSNKSNIDSNLDTKYENRNYIKRFFLKGIKYVIGMLIGVLSSCIIFVPTVLTILNGKGFSSGKLNTNWSSLISILKSYCVGVYQDFANPSFYCGSVAIIGFLGVFLLKKLSTSNKITIVVTTLVMLLAYYWMPLYYTYSLFNFALSHIYRFSYITIFFIIAIAGYFYSHIELEALKKLYIIPVGMLICLLIYNHFNKDIDTINILFTFVFLFATVLLLNLIFKKSITKESFKKFIALLISLLIFFELGYNAYSLFLSRFSDEITTFSAEYSHNMDNQIKSIKEKNNGNYRISETKCRVVDALCESLAYNYWSNASFTSCPDNAQLNFLNDLGYITEGDCITIVESSIVSADALLGVKYTLSDYPINGLIKKSEFGSYNNKFVYENPYSFPLAYTVNSYDTNKIKNNNPFEYQNELYSKLLGEKIEIFKPIEYTSNIESDKSTYSFSVPQGNYAYYGNIPYDVDINDRGSLKINDLPEFMYTGWNSQSVFYLPQNKDGQYTITLNANSEVLNGDAQFYALDLDRLEYASNKIKPNEVKITDLGKSSMNFNVESKTNCNLIISIGSRGWSARVNNENANLDTLEDCFISIPLKAGSNQISMKYNIPGLKLGFIISGITISGFILYCIIDKKHKSKQ